MSMPSLLIGFILGVMALWIYLELIAMAAKRRIPAPTMAQRKTGRSDAEAGVGERGVNYQWVNLTGEEQ